jgi:hypothetical protein
MVYVLDDSWYLISPTCELCRHRNHDASRTCSAFPGGIPLQIWNGLHDHTTPFPGDRGVRYERMSEEEERLFWEKVEREGKEAMERARHFREWRQRQVS